MGLNGLGRGYGEGPDETDQGYDSRVALLQQFAAADQ